VELRALENFFAAAGIFLRAESEVKLTVCIAVPPEMARMGIFVEITIGREVAMIGIGNGRQGRPCLREWTSGSEVSDADYSLRWLPWTAFHRSNPLAETYFPEFDLGNGGARLCHVAIATASSEGPTADFRSTPRVAGV
jgi:hypothetical protein